jgi:hemerythrin
MPFMQWSDKLSVGVKRFDRDHEKLVGLLNELYDATLEGHGKAALGPVVRDLGAYVDRHFTDEEQCMRAFDFPGLDAHMREHDAFRARLAGMREHAADSATLALSMEVVSFLRDWLLRHIVHTDKRYQSFLNAKGIK